jgi:hypothetical protein
MERRFMDIPPFRAADPLNAASDATVDCRQGAAVRVSC